jgi:hypothetical protein
MMEIRIGITQAPREVVFELEDEKARIAFKAAVEQAIAGKAETISVTDSKGREILVAAAKIAYVEFGAPEGTRKLGFGS